MEDLLDKLSSSHVSLDETDISLIHPRYCPLKKRIPEICNQEKRRQEWLDNLKAKRSKNLDIRRGIMNVKDPVPEVSMEIDKKEKRDNSKVTKNVRDYRGWLMLSEWLIEVPSDLHENWICKICPEGKRALVVAEMGTTNAYRRNGGFLCSEFPSWLPGGSKYTPRGKTILDAIFVRHKSLFYVLDVIHWGVETTEFEAELRFYWASNKIAETPQLKETFSTNRYGFIYVEGFPYLRLQEKMMAHPAFPEDSPKVDGILFYHKNSTYVHCRTPLVTWLKPFMLPDILAIEVAPEYLRQKPPEYQRVEMEVQDES